MCKFVQFFYNNKIIINVTIIIIKLNIYFFYFIVNRFY